MRPDTLKTENMADFYSGRKTVACFSNLLLEGPFVRCPNVRPSSEPEVLCCVY